MKSHHKRLLLLAIASLLFTTVTAEASLLGLYQFEDASGTVGSSIADTSGNLRHGAVVGADISLAAGQTGYGNAGGFGSGRVLANLIGAGTTVDDFAVAFWMQANNNSQSQTYLTGREIGGVPQLAVIYEYVNDRAELFRNGTGPDTRPGSQVPVADTAWHHVVYTRTGTDYDYYLDGAKTDIGTLSGPISVVTNLSIGSAANGAGIFNGQLDDVAWFGNGLDQTQVNTIMGGDFSAFTVEPPPSADAPGPLGPRIVADSYTYPAAVPGSGGNYADPGLTKLTDELGPIHSVWPSATDIGPLAGWLNSDMSTTFNFATEKTIDTVVAYLADSENTAGVGLPTTINLSTTDGYSQDFVVINPSGSGSTVPLAMSGLGLTTDNITLTVTRGHEWTMATEVEFHGTGIQIPYTYAYDQETVSNVTLAGNSGTTGGTEYTAPERLNDGRVSLSGEAGVYAWEAGKDGVIYGLNGTAFAQPGMTLDLGSEQALEALEITYFVRPASGVQAPSSLDITIDGDPLPQFTDFSNEIPGGNNFSANHTATIDLTGLSGQLLHLDFRNATGTQGGIGFWTGLTEIQVFTPATVPEPGTWTLMLLGSLGMLFAVRRRRGR